MMSPELIIVDYGLGNLYSLARAITHIGGNVTITDDSEAIAKAERLILPGVGAFGEGITNIQKKGLFEPLRSFALSGRPFLGICLGMQLLMETSEELGAHRGLSLIRGRVERFPESETALLKYKIPHIGWNKIYIQDKKLWNNTILDGINTTDFFYFVHSFIAYPELDDDVLARSVYGQCSFCAAIRKKNIYGCQFHPEKSGKIGLKILKNFLKSPLQANYSRALA